MDGGSEGELVDGSVLSLSYEVLEQFSLTGGSGGTRARGALQEYEDRTGAGRTSAQDDCRLPALRVSHGPTLATHRITSFALGGVL